MHHARSIALTAVVAALIAHDANAAPDAGPAPSTFSLVSPPVGEVVPRNAVVVGYLAGRAVGLDEYQATLVVPGQPVVDLSFETVRCGVHEHCLVQLRLGELPADTAFDVVIGGPDSDAETLSFLSSAESDVDAPTVPGLTLRHSTVSATNTEDGSYVVRRSVSFEPAAADDDSGISGYGFFVSAPNTASYVLADRHRGEVPPDIVSHSIYEYEASGVACYLWSAWDWAGNQGFSEEHCLDVTITEEEAAPFRRLCSSSEVPRDTPFTAFALLAGLFTLLWGARRRPNRPLA